MVYVRKSCPKISKQPSVLNLEAAGENFSNCTTATELEEETTEPVQMTVAVSKKVPCDNNIQFKSNGRKADLLEKSKTLKTGDLP